MPTETGRESAAERKTREAEEFSESRAANMGIVAVLRPSTMQLRHETRDDMPVPGSLEVTEGEVLVLELDIGGVGIVDVQLPWEGAQAVSQAIFLLHKDVEAKREGGEVEAGAKVLVAKDDGDVKQAARRAAAAEQLRAKD